MWAGLHLGLGVPLNAMLPAAERATPASGGAAGRPGQQAALSPARQHGAAVLLALVFAVTWFTSTAMAAHLRKLLPGVGASLAAAVGITALVGPAQSRAG